MSIKRAKNNQCGAKANLQQQQEGGRKQESNQGPANKNKGSKGK